MNTLFRRLPLTGKFLLIAIIPVALLVYFAYQIHAEKAAKLAILHTYLDRIGESVEISGMVDDLQTERRYSFGYVINDRFRGELVVQRAKVNAAMSRLQQNPNLGNVASYTMLDSLQAIRGQIDRNNVSPEDVMSYYTNAIFRLNTLNTVATDNVSYLGAISRELAGQKLLSEMITYMGLLRSNIYYALYTRQDQLQGIESLKSIYSIYKTYETELLLKGSPQAIASYKKLQDSSALRPTIAYIAQTFISGRLDTLTTAEQWWEVSANGVDQLKVLQRNELDVARRGINEIYKAEKSSQEISLIFLVLSILLVIGLVSYTIAIITNILKNLNQSAQLIAEGAPALPASVESNDVIGSLAQSIRRIDENNRVLAMAADAIGKSNFDIEVKPRSEADVLGNAVVRMKHDLQQFHTENINKLWEHEGIEQINESTRGEKTVAVLANDTLSALTEYTGAQVGMMYIRTDGTLDYAAGYGVQQDGSVPQRLQMGETLLGQAALKKNVMLLEDVPEDFVKVATGIGSVRARYIALVPLLYNGHTEGVIEIGSFSAFRPGVTAFLEQAGPVIAVALQSARSRARLQELLEETQAQAEELQVQQSELENVNSELEAQTEKLQASEEELRVQQEELLQANQELEERSRLLEERNQVIMERNLEVQKKADELALSTKYKSEFLANMSHELRTPLNSILLLSRLLSENNSGNLQKDQVEYAEVIQSSGQGLLLLIDEILDLSKIEAGKMTVEYNTVSFNEILNDIKSMFGPVAKEKGLALEVTGEEGLPSSFETDKLRLGQVLKNLLSNALKFTSDGSVSLSVSLLPDNPALVAFRVKDTGIGIPADKQQLIFEAFQQADGSTRRKFGGTGLGLSISREMVKLLKGEIKVSSEPGKGSEFTIYLPLNPRAVPDITARPAPLPEGSATAVSEAPPVSPYLRSQVIPENVPDDRAALAGGGKSILIIEDDTAFAKALLDFTRQRGYLGLVAVRGDDGLSLAREFLPAGILLDIQLPVKDGWEVMEELKSDPRTRHIPVHIMSSIHAKSESLHKGAVDFIDKPVAFDQMQEVFRKLEHVLGKENKKVLIVEENQQHARALAYFLESCNVNSEISASVNQSVDALNRKEVDCVILDMGIPDLHAYQTLETIKKNPGLENLPIIIFTGKNLSKAEELRIKKYADSIVIKTAHSYKRIIDEVSLFLHIVEEGKSQEKSKYKRLGALNEVLANKKILVTDDDVRNIFSLTKALEIHNMQVLTAVDGKDALQQLESNPDMDVVLMDIMMPEMDGYEAIQSIRKKPQFRKLPVIAVTAKAMTGDREKCIKAGASDYISKPVDIDQLLSLLRVWLYDKN
jgi:signal transduction histidine kinase/DNA-binding response OmpR family regulator